MLVFIRLYWFLSWALVTAVGVVVFLIVLRLISNLADLNPFTWTAITIRRLTDPLINPFRRGLVRLGIDPKYAPLVTILAVIVLGWFALQLLSAITNTFAGVFMSLRAYAPAATLGYVLYGLLALYNLMIFLRIILSWVMVSYSNQFMRFLVQTTEPLLGPLRRYVPTIGVFDISPIVAFAIVLILQAMVARTLLRAWPLGYFV